MKNLLKLCALVCLLSLASFGQSIWGSLPPAADCADGFSVILKPQNPYSPQGGSFQLPGTYVCHTHVWYWQPPKVDSLKFFDATSMATATVGMLPLQTGHANQLLDTNGTVAAWSGSNLTFDPSAITLTVANTAPAYASPGLVVGAPGAGTSIYNEGINVTFTSDDGGTAYFANITDDSDQVPGAFLGKMHSADITGLSRTNEMQIFVTNPSGTKPSASAFYGWGEMDGAGTLTQLIDFWAVTNFKTAGTVTNNYSFYSQSQNAGTNNFALWADEFSGGGLTDYYEWFDSRGVYRIKQDATHNAVAQAIPALYNPQFTKYTPGLANYERIVEQWDSNIAQIGVEVGGTGTARDLSLIGAHIRLPVASLSGTRFLCVDTNGVVSASASACSGT